jgi:hypothetical protein
MLKLVRPSREEQCGCWPKQILAFDLTENLAIDANLQAVVSRLAHSVPRDREVKRQKSPLEGAPRSHNARAVSDFE